MTRFIQFSVLLSCLALVVCDVSHLVQEEAPAAPEAAPPPPPPPPRPYAFSYTAGRFPGHSDRQHTEVGDGKGTVRGSYSYIDPRQQVRTVEYTADEFGFHPSLSHPAPLETVAVAAARDRHHQLYAQIAQDHANNPHPQALHGGGLPADTVAVSQARERHLNLFERIAAEHARIAAEREANKIAPDEPTDYQQ